MLPVRCTPWCSADVVVIVVRYQVAFPPDPRNIASPHLLGFGSWQPVGHRFEVGPGGIYTVALFDPQLQNDLSNVGITWP